MDWIGGLDWWTGLVDWTGGLDWWTVSGAEYCWSVSTLDCNNIPL